MAQGGKQKANLICTVDTVDKDARTVDCTPIDEGAPLLGVNLQANQESKFGVVVFPRVGSYIVVGFVAEGSAGVVLMTDDIESIEVVVSDDSSRMIIDENGARIDVGDNISVEVTKDGVVLNDGSLGGMVKLQELNSNLDQLKSYVETMKTAISTGLNAVGASTAASGAAGAAAFDLAMSAALISFQDMENKKVKQ